MKRLLRLLVVASCLLLSAGCATLQLKLDPGETVPVPEPTGGTLLLKPLRDERPLGKRHLDEEEEIETLGYQIVGFFGFHVSRWNRFGTENRVKAATVLTGSFARALRQSGYRVVLAQPGQEPPPHDAVLEGFFDAFTVASSYAVVCHIARQNIRVNAKLLAPGSQTPLWDKWIESSAWSGVWTQEGYESVVTGALSGEIRSAARQFSTDEFRLALAQAKAARPTP